MTPGFLIHYMGKTCFRFCSITKDGNKINNSLRWSERIFVNNKQENNILLFVEPLDYSKETVTSTATTAGTAAGTAAAVAVASASAASTTTTWNAAKKEFKEMGKIPGGIFLTGNGKLIWISHYDQKELGCRPDDEKAC